MLNSQKKELVGFEEIAHIFLSMQKEDKCEQRVSAGHERPDATSGVRFIPVVGSIHAKKKSFFLKQICIELINHKYNSIYYDTSQEIMECFNFDKFGKKDFLNIPADNFYKKLVTTIHDKSFIFYDMDFDFSDEEYLFDLEKEIFFLLSLESLRSKDYMELILELIAKKKDLVVWLAFTDCNPNIKLDNFFAEINYNLSNNLIYCGVVPSNMPNYQMLLGDRVIKLANNDKVYPKEIARVVDSFLAKSNQLDSFLFLHKKFLDEI